MLAVAEREQAGSGRGAVDVGRLKDLLDRGARNKPDLDLLRNGVPIYSRFGQKIHRSVALVPGWLENNKRPSRENLAAFAALFGDPLGEWLEACGYDPDGTPITPATPVETYFLGRLKGLSLEDQERLRRRFDALLSHDDGVDESE